MFWYSVEVDLVDAAMGAAWVRWMEEEHLAGVLAGGARAAWVVARGPAQFTAHYSFASAEDFAVYERDFAPALREEGRKRFPVEAGVVYRRAAGPVVLTG